MANKMLGRELRGLFEEIVRDEVRQALAAPRPHSWVELVTDPTSKELSMSRLAIGVLVVDMTAVLACSALGLLNPEKLSPITTMFSATVASVAGIYGLNSLAGAIGGGQVQVAWEKAKGFFGFGGTPGSKLDPGSTANQTLSAE
ncbi:MAG: hypothetical protein FJ134_04335 [Deltaproteobacteria bacterium]|nr:hypothetical protein [Deltaproteobacteria bacterium]